MYKSNQSRATEWKSRIISIYSNGPFFFTAMAEHGASNCSESYQHTPAALQRHSSKFRDAFFKGKKAKKSLYVIGTPYNFWLNLIVSARSGGPELSLSYVSIGSDCRWTSHNALSISYPFPSFYISCVYMLLYMYVINSSLVSRILCISSSSAWLCWRSLPV